MIRLESGSRQLFGQATRVLRDWKVPFDSEEGVGEAPFRILLHGEDTTTRSQHQAIQFAKCFEEEDRWAYGQSGKPDLANPRGVRHPVEDRKGGTKW